MEETKIDLCICACALLLYLGVGVWGFFGIRKARKAGELPPADRKFRPALIASAALLVLPFLIYFKPYVTAVLEACAVLGRYITLRERLGTDRG
ncbi:MAG: hypothetical protein ILP18_10240, partial [Treponema sp.]|nr:hypothetical protein [Treponema sp.]